ncbi:MAG TPA: alpha/beta hydrolase, partial [Candidatus Kapabacteria bacterium]
MTLKLQDATISYELRNWDIVTDAPPLLFLHSALSTRKEFDALSQYFANRRQILFDFPSHGESTTSQTSFTASELARYTRSLLEHLEVYSVDIIGYSMGGYVGIELALMAPSMVKSIVSHAMKFYWTESAIVEATTGLDVDKIKARSQKGYDMLSGMHEANGLEKTVALTKSIITNFAISQLREEDLSKLNCPLLLSVGDRDELVSLEEISKLYLALDKKKVSLAVHANSPHPISKLDKESFTHAVREFWKF